MKFLVDAQLPRSLCRMLSGGGHDAVHTFELPLGNRTPDATICEIALQEARIVVTKDADFVNMFLLHGIPEKLLLVAIGNISNAELEAILSRELAAIVSAFATHHFIALDRFGWVIRF